jgi:hypothetical protein
MLENVLIVGGGILVGIMALAIIGLGFGVVEVSDLLMILHLNGTLYIPVIVATVLVVLALTMRAFKRDFCAKFPDK